MTTSSSSASDASLAPPLAEGESGTKRARTAPSAALGGADTVKCASVALQLRAEGGGDLLALMKRLPNFKSSSVFWGADFKFGFFDNSLTLRLRGDKAVMVTFLRELIAAIKAVPDGHVMLETLHFADAYDGERDSERAATLERQLPGFLVLVALD